MTERKGLLPIVNKETGCFVHREIQKDSNYLIHRLKGISKSNPILADYMLHFSRGNINPNLTLYPGIVVYNLLEKTCRLPVVTNDALDAVKNDLFTVDNYVSKIVKNLQEDNLYIANFLCEYALSTSDPVIAAYGGVLVYESLEKQVELNISVKRPKTWKFLTQLRFAIKEERYEDAAKLRDEINKTNEPLVSHKG